MQVRSKKVKVMATEVHTAHAFAPWFTGPVCSAAAALPQGGQQPVAFPWVGAPAGDLGLYCCCTLPGLPLQIDENMQLAQQKCKHHNNQYTRHHDE